VVPNGPGKECGAARTGSRDGGQGLVDRGRTLSEAGEDGRLSPRDRRKEPHLVGVRKNGVRRHHFHVDGHSDLREEPCGRRVASRDEPEDVLDGGGVGEFHRLLGHPRPLRQRSEEADPHLHVGRARL
jgi:hypothetical protein